MALTISNYWGAETGGLEEVYGTVGAPTVSSSVVHSGTYAYQIGSSAAIKLLASHTGSANPPVGTAHIITAWLRLSSITPASTINIMQVTGAGSTVTHLSIALNSSGQILYRDANEATVRTVTSPPITANTWHKFQLYFVWSDTVGEMELFIDNASQGANTGLDTNDAGATSYGAFYIGDASGSNSITIYADDIVWQADAASSSDRISNVEIFSYRSNLNSATPDVGTALDTGTWLNIQERPFSDTNTASYTVSTAAGSVTTNDVGGSAGTGGPNTDANITGTLAAVKGIWRAYRGGGGAASHWGLLGNSVDGTTRSDIFALTTAYDSYFFVSEATTIKPEANEYGRIGFEVSGARDFIVADMLLTVLHIPPSGKGIIYNPAYRYMPFLTR